METLFKNEDFILKSTGHDYDFVGTLEVKNDKSITFFFEEELFPIDENDEDSEWDIDESQTTLLNVEYGLNENEVKLSGNATSFFTHSKNEDWMGFLSDCKQRGWFLALIKHYCPEKLNRIAWA